MSLNQKGINPNIAFNYAWQPFQGPFSRWPRISDTLLSIFAMALMIFTTTVGDNQDMVFRTLGEVQVSEILISIIAGGSLYYRRSNALLVLGTTLILTVISSGLGHSTCLSSLPIALYSVGRYETNERWSQFAVESTIILIGIKGFFLNESMADVASGFIFIFLIWYVATRIRHRGEHLKQLKERAIHLEKEREAESRRVVAEERTRIARELHDVVAHRVSLMTVQAAAAKTVAGDEPASALKAMEAIEIAGRQALDELRHLVGILRPNSESEGLLPQSGLSDIPRLVEGFRQAGLDIALTMNQHQVDLPSHVDLSTFRIIQEALTNVLKHAGPNAVTQVIVSSDRDGVTIEVRDKGHGVTILPGSGHGIVGMRERAQLLGGSFKAGPLHEGGFEVVAHLPIADPLP